MLGEGMVSVLRTSEPVHAAALHVGGLRVRVPFAVTLKMQSEHDVSVTCTQVWSRYEIKFLKEGICTYTYIYMQSEHVVTVTQIA